MSQGTGWSSRNLSHVLVLEPKSFMLVCLHLSWIAEQT